MWPPSAYYYVADNIIFIPVRFLSQSCRKQFNNCMIVKDAFLISKQHLYAEHYKKLTT